MSSAGIREIRIRYGDTVFHVHGPKAGLEGVWLAKDQVNGLYEAPVKTTYKTGAFQRGSTQKAVKWLHRDLELGFHITDTITDSYEFAESKFRQCFHYELDKWSEAPRKTTIEVDTTLSGTRKLDVLMHEEPQFQPASDPIKNQFGNVIMRLRAAQPFWYEDDYTSEFTGTATTAAGVVVVENPTDQEMLHRWVVTSAKGGGDISWTLPDFQWVGDPGERVPGGDDATRLLDSLIITEANDGAIIEPVDRSELQFRDTNDTNILGQMGGNRFFKHSIPPWTPPFDLPVSYKGAIGGGTCQLVMPRKWSKPWGLEAETVVTLQSPQDCTFHVPVGTFSYRIPDWCERLDIICLGGGGGGEGGGLIHGGSGGSPAGYAYATVIRGVDIPWDTYYLAGSVGAGGRRGLGVDTTRTGFGDWGGVDGQDGEPSYCEAAGMQTISSAGGEGGRSQPTTWGIGATALEFNTKQYPGSENQRQIGTVGNFPGGGGAGGWPLVGPAGDGADGKVWIRAYGWSGS